MKIKKKFEPFWRKTKKKLSCGGVVLLNNKRILLVVTEDNLGRAVLNLPMGKSDHADEGNLKVTSVRELGEEV